MKKKTEHLYTVVLIAVLIFGLSIFAVLKPAGDFSESERRPLEQLPELSVKTLLNGDFMENFEDVERLLQKGEEKAREIAKETIARVRKAVGVD